MNNPPRTGLTMSPDGKLWWSFADKKDSYLYCMDAEKLVCMLEKKKRSALRAVFEEAVNISAAFDDNLCFMDEPFPDNGDVPTVTINGREYYRSVIEFRYLKAIKEKRKQHALRLSFTYNWDVYVPDECYDQVLEFILAHCPDIKRK